MEKPFIMNLSKERKCDIFRNISTYMDSYRSYNDGYEKPTKYTRAKVEKPIPKLPSKTELDLQTLIPLKKRIPYNLMIYPNEMSGRNLYLSKNERVISDDSLDEEVARTRPRVYQTPQVNLDDIPNEKMRKSLLSEIYTSVSKKKELEFLKMMHIEKELLEQYRRANYNLHQDIRIHLNPRRVLEVKMTPSQNERGKIWTNEQLVLNVDTTQHFWQNQQIQKADPDFTRSIDEDIKDRISDLVRKDRISLAHDYPCPGYAGHRPLNAVGIEISKKYLPQAHYLVSTYQSVFNSRTDGANNPKSV